MDLSEQDLRELCGEIERIILACSTETHIKKTKFDYFLTPKEAEVYVRTYQIAAANIRQGITKVFEKYLDADLVRRVEEETQKRKEKYAGRGRKANPKPTSEPTSETNIGKFKVKSFE